MKLLSMGLMISIFLISSSFANATLELNPELGKSIRACRASNSKKFIWIFKQWHLGPMVNTKENPKPGVLPQSRNQTSIYLQLEEWVKTKRLAELYAEGCEGEINSDSKFRVNGWDYESLKKISSETVYPEVLSSVPLKIEAKYGTAIRTLCGDDNALVSENSLAFSDARGAIGFLSRLEQYQADPVRAKTYLEGAIQAFKMPASSTIDQAITRSRKELKAAVVRIQDGISKRNRHFVQLLKKSEKAEAALVIGGIHADGLVKLLDDEGVGCAVVEPTGYQNDELDLLEKLKKAVEKI